MRPGDGIVWWGWRSADVVITGEWLAIGIRAALATCALTSVIGEPARWRRARPDNNADNNPLPDDDHGKQPRPSAD
ncbi:hypothetical protein GCM10023321_48740 [Pseudonocardia eucalypti]|uniref:Uncharacterized protein n=1 Tax=Pseudonocardia eucalypti TaxID=648755 RepID=A0ABP9QJC3_9PSEU